LDLTSTGNYIYEAIDKLEDNVDQLVTDLNSAHTTTRGDLIYKGASTVGRLAVGNAGQILGNDGTDPVWTALMLNGFVQRPKFIWKDVDEFYIDPGVYHHSGTTNQLVYWDSQLTYDVGTPTASTWHYVYLDDSAIITNAAPLLDNTCFTNNVTPPTWTVAKHGWYNGSDRCIFAFMADGSSQVDEFYHDGGRYLCYANYESDIDDQDIDDSWEDIGSALTMPSFAIKANVTFSSTAGDANGALYWRPNGQTATAGHNVLYSDTDLAFATVPTDVITDSGHLIELLHVAGTSVTSCWTNGWYFPAGM